MVDFEIGDQVVCIRQSEINRYRLDMSKIYKVSDLNKNKRIVWLKGKVGFGHISDRFIEYNGKNFDKKELLG